MVIEIKYKDLNSVELSKEQTEGLDYFSVEKYIDGELKQVDNFEHGKLHDGDYFLSTDENLQEVLKELKSRWVAGTFLFNKQRVGSYTVWDWEIYRGFEKLEMGKMLFDKQWRVITNQYINKSNLNITYTNKNYYLTNWGGFLDQGDIYNFGILEFTYNFDYANQITVEVNLPGFELEDHTITQTKNILNHPIITPLFSWDEQTYYHNDKLIP